MKYSVRICYRLYYFNTLNEAESFGAYWGGVVTDEGEWGKKIDRWMAYPKPTHSIYHETAERQYRIQRDIK